MKQSPSVEVHWSRCALELVVNTLFYTQLRHAYRSQIESLIHRLSAQSGDTQRLNERVTEVWNCRFECEHFSGYISAVAVRRAIGTHEDQTDGRARA